MHQVVQNKSYLHFGAVVSISCFNKDTKFYMYSDGISFKTILSIAENQTPYDPSLCLFRIKPAMKFNSNQNLESILNNRYNQQVNGIGYDQKKTKSLLDQFEFQLKQNIKLKQQQSNYPLKYNQNFMLQHVFSSNYLCFKKNNDLSQYSLQLTSIPNTLCLLNLKACFNYQKDVNTYVPFNSAAYLNVKFQQGLVIRQMNLNFLPNSIYESWLFSQESQDKIKIQLYKTGEQIQYKNICYGDNIWIFHLESGSFVKVIQQNRQSNSVMLKKIKYTLGYSNQVKESKQNQQNIKAKIIIQKADNQMSAQKFGLWQIIPVIKKDTSQSIQRTNFIGGKVKFEDQVRFLNVKYKAYLSVRKIKKGRNKFQFQYAIQESEEQNTVFQIKNLSSKNIQVTTQDLFLIRNVFSNTYLTLSVPFPINQTQAFLTPSSSYKKEDNFRFSKIEFIQLWQNDYLLSTMPYITQGIRALQTIKNGQISCRDEVMLRLLCENLTQIMAFSFDLTQGFEASQNKIGKMAYNHFQIQKLFREQEVVSKLIKILQIINPDFFFDQKMNSNKKMTFKMSGMLSIIKKYGVDSKSGGEILKKVDANLLQKIVTTCLKILRNNCRSNTQNSLYIYQHSKVIFKFLSLRTYAQNFIIDSFSNSIILQKMTTQDFKNIIDQYIKVYKVTRVQTEKIFILLSKLIIFQNKGISKNQLEIYKLFFYKQNPLMIMIESFGQRFFINKIQLSEFCSDFPQLASILGYQIKFSAQLSADRNYLCSKTIKQWYPFLKTNSQSENKIKFCLDYNSYLFKLKTSIQKGNPLNFSISDNLNSMKMQQQYKSKQSNYQIQMKIMKDQGLSKQIIQDIFSCIHEGSQISDKQLQNLKKFIFEKVQKFSNEKTQVQSFYSSKMQSYMICLKYLIQLSVFEHQQTEKIQKMIQKIANKVTFSLTQKNNNVQKLQSTNFRQLLLQMVQKNVIKKFNYAANYDGIQDQISADNICSIFVNYSFYQNILLQQKNSQKRKQTDSVSKVVLQLIQVYGEITQNQKIHKFVDLVTKPQNIKSKSKNKTLQIKQIVIDNIFEPKENRSDIFNLLVLLFYNSNTYQVNSISLNSLLSQIFCDRLTMHQLSKLQFSVGEDQKQQVHNIKKICKNIKSLNQTSQIWLNLHQIVKNKTSKYDTVSLLFVNKLKRLLKFVMVDFDQQCDQPFYCYKYANSIVPQKQQIIANQKVHEQIITFISNYRSLMIKIKAGSIKVYNHLLVPIFKFCFLFLFVFIYDSPENKNQLRALAKQSYLRDYISYVDKMELGEGMFVIQYLKNNYEQSLEFFSKNTELFQKHHKYTATHSRLLLTLLNFYNQPIQTNLRNFYITIFDFTSFKTFMWLKPNGTQFNLQQSLFTSENNMQPYLYHIHVIQVILQIITHIKQSRNNIRQHMKKSLSQQYLFSLLLQDDFYTKENSQNSLLKIMIHFKSKIMKLIQFAYFSEDSKNDNLILLQFRRHNQILTKFIQQAPARQENEDFRKIILVRNLKQNTQNKRVRQLYENNLNYNKNQHIIEVYLNSVNQFCLTYIRNNKKSKQSVVQKMVIAANQIHIKVANVYDILHKSSKKIVEQDEYLVEKYPVPYQWLFNLSSAFRDQYSIQQKKYLSSFMIETVFSKQLYAKFHQNEKKLIEIFRNTLQRIKLNQFMFLRKISQYMEDAFQKLSNHPTLEMYESLNLLINFLKLWIQCEVQQKVNDLRSHIGKSQLIFPILNFFQICPFNKHNKQLFLNCLQFFNELIGQDGNKSVQVIFNQYFTNNSDSIEVFMKIKSLFDAISFVDRANYKCKRIYDSIEALQKDSKFQYDAQFIILNFLIRLCKGNFRDNQIFLSSLGNTTNFNIMSGIWQILKLQAQKYKKNLVNAGNYHLISQCFSTIRQLVQGPCTQNQNQFLKRDFFLTVIQYFQFQITKGDLNLQKNVQQKLEQIGRISQKFTQSLRIYLNRDKITQNWMPSQVKYRCINLICSLLSENVTEQNKSQLYTIEVSLIIKQLDKVYNRYVELGLSYTYENLQAKQNTQIVLPLGFKLYELLQYYPVDKLPQHSPGLDFFRLNSRVVEVLHHKLSVVYFPRIPDQISTAFKQKFIQQVDRSSVNSKLRGLQFAQVQNKQSDYPYGISILIITIVTTILDLMLYNADTLQSVQLFNFSPIFRLYGFLQVQQIIATGCIVLTILLSIIFLFLQARGAVYFKEQFFKIIEAETTRFQKFKQIVKFLWQNLTYFHYFLTLILAILAIFNPFFDALLLLVELNRRSQTFSAIINAITQTLDQLLVVLLFVLVCTYVLSLFLYYYRASVSYGDQCSTMFNCFVFSLDLGFRADAGIAGYNDNNPDSVVQMFASYPIQDVLVNFIYLFIIKMVIQQIIGAIIIDKFAALRQAEEKIKQDQQSFCFICGLDRSLLDRQQDGFDHHKQFYHSVWNYFQFLIYLRKSKYSNLSGIQLFVFDQQSKGQLKWFPINRSYHLQNKNQQQNQKQIEQDNLEKFMKILDLQVTQLNNQSTLIWNLLNVKLAKQKKNMVMQTDS